MSEPIYRPNAGLMIINDKGEIFIGKRNDIRDESWQMPQGGIDEGEDILAAARRELFEETSIPQEDVELLAIHPEWLTYTYEKKGKSKHDGQKQKWFLFRYNGDEKKINVKKCATPEFNAWRWAEADEVLDIIWKPKREVYEAVLKAFAKHLKDGGLSEEASLEEDQIDIVDLEDKEEEDPAAEAIAETQSA